MTSFTSRVTLKRQKQKFEDFGGKLLAIDNAHQRQQPAGYFNTLTAVLLSAQIKRVKQHKRHQGMRPPLLKQHWLTESPLYWRGNHFLNLQTCCSCIQAPRETLSCTQAKKKKKMAEECAIQIRCYLFIFQWCEDRKIDSDFKKTNACRLFSYT